MQESLIYCYTGKVENIIKKFKEELHNDSIKVIATGGLGKIIYSQTDYIDIFDSKLLLKGLKIIHDKNNKYCSLINKTKKSNDFDNNMEKLDKLTILNMGARYELLNANKMMMYLDLGFVLLNLIIEFKQI